MATLVSRISDLITAIKTSLDAVDDKIPVPITRSNLDILAGGDDVIPGRMYLISDERYAVAVGVAVDEYDVYSRGDHNFIKSVTEPTDKDAKNIWIKDEA